MPFAVLLAATAALAAQPAQVAAQDARPAVEERVAGYKKIRAVEFIDEIPKNPSGKILRRVLKERS